MFLGGLALAYHPEVSLVKNIQRTVNSRAKLEGESRCGQAGKATEIMYFSQSRKAMPPTGPRADSPGLRWMLESRLSRYFACTITAVISSEAG